LGKRANQNTNVDAGKFLALLLLPYEI